MACFASLVYDQQSSVRSNHASGSPQNPRCVHGEGGKAQEDPQGLDLIFQNDSPL